MEMLKRFWEDEAGLELSEYAVMMALIIVLIIGAIILLSNAITQKFTQTADIIETGGQ